MLFRAVISEHGDFKCLQNIVSTLSKNSKELTLNLREDSLVFVIRDESRRCLPIVWADVRVDSCFGEYQFKGISDEHNEIVLALNSTFLARALSPVRAFEYVKFKLLKIQENSFLMVEILVISTICSEKKTIVHNIPVRVILPRLWSDYCLPQLDDYNTIIELPNVKHIVEKYKNLSPYLTIFADVSERRLHLTIETDMTTLISNFHNLEAEYRGNTLRSSEDTIPNREFSCQVETKSLSLFLSSIPYHTIRRCLWINTGHSVKFKFMVKENVSICGIACQITS